MALALGFVMVFVVCSLFKIWIVWQSLFRCLMLHKKKNKPEFVLISLCAFILLFKIFWNCIIIIIKNIFCIIFSCSFFTGWLSTPSALPLISQAASPTPNLKHQMYSNRCRKYTYHLQREIWIWLWTLPSGFSCCLCCVVSPFLDKHVYLAI